MSQEVWFNKKKNTYVKYEGKRNKISEANKTFVSICKCSQKQLKNVVTMELYEFGYKDVIIGDGYVYARGELPICLTAHLDTVHTELVTTVYEANTKDGDIISSPQGIGGDDRCGIYMILMLLAKGYKPYVIFCEDEEIGCIGSQKFCKTEYIKEIGEKCNYIIELDRANSKDSVYYDCANDKFEKFITETIGYKTAYGSCSDISYLCPQAKIAGVNLSCGYYNAHTLGEYVNMSEMRNTMCKVEVLLTTESPKFEYVEKTYNKYSSLYGKYYGGYNYWNDDYHYNKWSNYYSSTNTKTKNEVSETYLWVEYYVDKASGVETKEYEITAESLGECWYSFFLDHPDVCYNQVLNAEYY